MIRVNCDCPMLLYCKRISKVHWSHRIVGIDMVDVENIVDQDFVHIRCVFHDLCHFF